MPLSQNSSNSNNENKKFDFKKAFSDYAKHWKWFALGCLIFLGHAYYKYRHITPMYTATGKILLLNGEVGSGNPVLRDLSILSSEENAMVVDEIQVIKSRDLLQNLARKLKLNIKYFVVGRVNEYELYKNSPFDINFMVSDSILQERGGSFYIDIISKSHVEFRANKDDVPKKYAFGTAIQSPVGEIILTPKEDITGAIGSSVRVQISPIHAVADALKSQIHIAPSEGGSKVLDIYLDAEVVDMAIDIINQLVVEYNLATIQKNKERADHTSKFIDDRVETIASDLTTVDDSIVKFKSVNRITDMASKSGMLSSSSVSNEQQLQELSTRRNMLDYMLNMLNTTSYEILPSNLGAGDAAISGLATRYNGLLERRKVLLKSAGENNSVVLELDQSLNAIKQNLNGSLNNTIKTIDIQMNSLHNQLSSINSKIAYVPAQESKLISIGRKQSIKEALYLYLLQKREEAEISQTTTLPNAKVIDSAYSLGAISNNTSRLFASAVLMGLLVPFVIIYGVSLFDTKIHNKEDLENQIRSITVLGEIPKIKNETDKLIRHNDRSILSESFRIIRTNFEFLNRDIKTEKYRNVIFVTSTINGEGKSFVSLNTALTLSNTGKKVLLIGADLRNPQIFSAIKKDISDERVKVGLSEYLADYSVPLENVITNKKINKISLDILFSGQIPPNPAELLMDQRLETLFDEVSENYDYVVVDTAPSMLVTDTLLMHKYAGHTIYVTRAGYTEKRILNFAKELYDERKLNHMMLVVNDVKESNFGYGAKYGYYGAPEKKGFFKFGKKKKLQTV